MAKGSVRALTLLDLSAAFDTTDHTVLLDRLHTFFGVRELALGWFELYLSERTHLLKVGSILSYPAEPQGCVLSPILFLSIQTQSARSFSHTVVSITISMSMIPNYA